MKNLILNIVRKLRNIAVKIKTRATALESDRRKVNAVMAFNIGVTILFAITVTFIDRNMINRLADLRNRLVTLKELSSAYEITLTSSQVTLQPQTRKIVQLTADLGEMNKSVTEAAANIGDPRLQDILDKFMIMLEKRFAVREELIERYAALYRVYKDYLMIADETEKDLFGNMTLQLHVKKVMLSLENARIIASNRNRDNVRDNIRDIRNALRAAPPALQAQVALFADRAEEIVKLLRYLDTVRASMRSDGHDQAISVLDKALSEKMAWARAYFRTKMFFLIILSGVISVIQALMTGWFFIGRRKSETLRAAAEEEMLRSKQIITRARQYAAEAQNAQFKILYNFCHDLTHIFSTLRKFGKTVLDDQERSSALLGDKNNKGVISAPQDVKEETLSSALAALDDWVENYLDIHTAREEWRPPEEQTFSVEKTVEKTFVAARFFAHDNMRFLAMYGDDLPKGLLTDSEYVRLLFKNMLFVTLKAARETPIKTAYRFEETEKEGQTLRFFILETYDRADETNFNERARLFNASAEKKEAEASSDKKSAPSDQKSGAEPSSESAEEEETQKGEERDRFTASALFYVQTIADLLGATLEFTRMPTAENLFSARIPVKVDESQNEPEIGTPLLQNKNVIIVSASPNILYTLQSQLKAYGMNVSAIADKFAAIGHIIGGGGGGEQPDLIIIDHQPPDIDAAGLSKIVHDNLKTSLFNVIVLCAEEDYPDLQGDNVYFDEILLKPVVPSHLKNRISHYIDLQLYGAPDLDDDDTMAPVKTKKVLTVMDENLSRMLVQMILTGSDFDVDVAENGEQVMECLDRKRYDFILIAEPGPGLSAETLIREIRRHRSDNQSSVIFVVCEELKDSVKAKFVKAGCDDYILLPLSKVKMMEKIEEWSDPVNRRVNGPYAAQDDAVSEDDSPNDEGNSSGDLEEFSEETAEIDDQNDPLDLKPVENKGEQFL